MEQELFTRFLKGDDTALSPLMRLYNDRVERLARSKSLEPGTLVKKVTLSFVELRSRISPAPSFLHWLFLFSLKNVRELKTGQSDFAGLFETAPEEFTPAQDFGQELSKYLEWMTDDKMEHYRMRFEDGLVFEEMAALLSIPAKPSEQNFSVTDWLEDWRLFLTKPKEA
jgi:hypothetical protein